MTFPGSVLNCFIYGWHLGNSKPADILVHPPVRSEADLPSPLHNLPPNPPPCSADWVQCYPYDSEHLVVHYHHPDGAYYYVLEQGGNEVWILSHAENIVDTFSLLTSTVMALISRLRGRLTLHGAAVEVGGHTIALLADKGAGKSTTSMALLRRGHALLSDDTISIQPQDGMLIYPGLEQSRQTLNTLRHFGLNPDEYPPIFIGVPPQTQDKRIVPLHKTASPRFQPQPRPLAAIYLLGRGAQTETEIVPLTPVQATRKLLPHISFTPWAVTPAEFRMLGRLASCVPVRQISFPSDLAQLDRLCARLEVDLRSIAPQSGDV